ncbi:MAG: UDP-N-acetylmuramate dehydrogenase [Parachlamydiaceae bacterium]|nr:UDP-N-acetylmuramate dehydrogenase [Parachlamydiaceae bacterium]
MGTLSFQENKLLSALCTFGIGGPARYFAEIHSIPEMQQAILVCLERQIPYFILGKGSNCLFDDRGFNGAVFLNKIDFLERPSTEVYHVGAGYSFSLLGTQSARHGMSGLEFASGIPGSVGGAVFMNAGANGRETCESLESVDFVDESGQFVTLKKNELHFAYRTSSFHHKKGAIVGATFVLTPLETARAKQIEIITYRKKTQPYGDMSAGCIFRNPNCGHAGALIDQSGLKGTQIGDAKVSEIHANFIVNVANASSKEVLELISLVQAQVKLKTGADLQSEVRYISPEGVHE